MALILSARAGCAVKLQAQVRVELADGLFVWGIRAASKAL
jgi:hypothetical protein